jgi:CelD/BcsL family acetyltransferase involved in cellulose biosynthesis
MRCGESIGASNDASTDVGIDARIEADWIREPRRLFDLARDWDRLCDASPEATVFARFAWTSSLLEAFGAGLDLWALVLRQGGVVVGILPWVRRTVRVHGIGYRELGFFHGRHALRNAALLEPSLERDCLASALRHLRGTRGWDVLWLENLPAGAAKRAGIEELAASQGLATDPSEPGRLHRFVGVQGDWDGYLASRSGNCRWQLKKFARLGEGAGGLEFERIDDRVAIERALPAFFELERASWQGNDTAAAMTEADRSFHRTLVQRLPAGELGELWFLRVAGRPAAGLRLLRSGDVLYVFAMHYHPEQSELSPGTLLFARVLESAWERGLAGVDCHGDTRFFERWATGATAHVHLRVYAPRIFPQILRTGRRLRRRGRPEAAGAE